MDAIFELENVSYTYLRRFEALRDVNLRINFISVNSRILADYLL